MKTEEQKSADPFEDSRREADRILALAGWKSHPDWEDSQFARANLVGGIHPDGQGCSFKDWAKIPPGHPLYSPDTPDTPHEAAQWLVDNVSKGATAKRYRYKRKAVARAPEAGDSAPHAADPRAKPVPAGPADVADDTAGGAAAHGEGPHGSAPDSDAGGDTPERGEDLATHPAGDDLAIGEESVSRGTPEERVAGVTDAAFAEFGDLPALEDTPTEIGVEDELAALPEPEDLGSEILDTHPEFSGHDRFYGLDDLDRRRSLRIGDVIRYALEHTPALSEEHAMRLRELRSYVSGVAEGSVTRSSDDQAMRAELNALEAAAALERRWDARRDAKVAYLVAATREQVEAFDVEADWP